ncbi:VPS10 domain-containing protein [Algoriphagus machipongonensis]|uniref:Glycosyl hydrolase, BNR repeat n=1 Tax=Algoriphagus machipongonensis TaxID=388413 RepID=A3HYQ7_9BACT|nr:glycosyhydrolase [Algoriphagus machipongonensis]EAZ80393.1 putative glycosyl hydrolase, BNR repeat [Algoriphagus machipongonensis]
MKRTLLSFLTLLILTSITLAQTSLDEQLNNHQFRFIGPEGNRAIAVIGEPGNPQVAYIGAASGGLWKTEDMGINWRPIFDDQDISSVAAVELAPSDPNQVWVGTGETFVIRPAHAMGNGIYFSPDAGKTWEHKGLEKTGRIGRVLVHPKDPKIIYAASLGHTYGPQKERGIFRSKDGGDTWEHVLFIDEGTGASDLAIDPQNPDILYAAMWSIHINTWGLNSGGEGSGIYKSTDGGDTWEPMSKNGLTSGAERPVGKTSVAVSHSDPNVVYALFEAESPEVWRSSDKGMSWTLMSQEHDWNERAPYYTRLRVNTGDPNEIYSMSVRFVHSLDGGKTRNPRPPRGGGDNHDIWIDPTDPDRIMVAHDGGVSISYNHGKSFQGVVLPIAQMYHVAVDDQIPYNVFGNRQDGWSYMGPSNSLAGYIPLGLWKGVGGCESGFAKPDPVDNNIIWSGCYDGGLERHDLRTGQSREVRVWPEAGYGWAPADLKYRWHWNFPLSHSPHTEGRVYVGSQFVHKTDDDGQSWQIISPDLTLNLKDHQKNSGGVAIDNLMTFDGATLFAIEESKFEAGVIWVGTNDGQVQLTRDGGENWTNLTANIPDLPKWGTIANIEPSRFDKSTAYITVDLHQMGDFDPYIFKTTDYGQSWTKISDGIPSSESSFVHVIKEDPKREGLLYAGIDKGIYISHNDGQSWSRLKLNLPPAPVYWMEIQERFDDLVVGTYGRGYYILDDLAAIRNLDQNQTIAFYDVRDAYRFNDRESIKTDGRSNNSGRNPSYGASLNYHLPENFAGEAKIEIKDSKGELVRTLQANKKAGANRAQWDLRYEPTYTPKLRVAPPGRPWVQLNGEGWRPLVQWDLDLMAGQYGPRVVPGEYMATLILTDSAGNEVVQTSAKFNVLKDPYSEGSLEDIQEQVAFSLQLRDAMNLAVSNINAVEQLRKELDIILEEESDSKTQKEALRLKEAAEEVASKLYDIHLTGAREDAFRSPIKLYGRLSALASDINASGMDYRPTDQQGEVYEVLDARLKVAIEQFSDLVNNDIQEFNKALERKNRKIEIEKTGGN